LEVALSEFRMARAVNEDLILTAEGVFREYLRERGLKYTGERELVLHAVMRTDEHFEAEQLVLNMRQAQAHVGKATVYRTLKLLVDCRIVREVYFSNKLAHYEHAYGQAPHDHMVCRRCGRIIEFDAAEVVRLRSSLAAERGFHAQTHRFQIIGVCEKCVNAGTDEE
jgi:Fur family transcriptional regulator, ferric uptake regulator